MDEQYYNAVLLPPAALDNVMTEFAQGFKAIADGYCLGPALPHVTLCQTHLIRSDQADRLKADLQIFSVRTVSLKCVSYYVNNGLRSDNGKPVLHCGLNVTLPNETLMALQKDVADIFAKQSLMPRNPSGDDYWPHVTFARFAPGSLLPAMTLPSSFWQEHDGWRFAFGRNDMAGQFLEVMN